MEKCAVDSIVYDTHAYNNTSNRTDGERKTRSVIPEFMKNCIFIQIFLALEISEKPFIAHSIRLWLLEMHDEFERDFRKSENLFVWITTKCHPIAVIIIEKHFIL